MIMKKMPLILITALLSLVFTSCSMLEMRLVRERAGDNWSELEKVIDRYKREGDKEKIEAVYFLLENLPYQSYILSDDLVEAKREWYPMLRERTSTEYKAISDSLAEIYDITRGLKRVWDVQVLDSAFICENIDMAFKVCREQPWGKNVDFVTFCKYILPYRISDEIPELWRTDYYERYSCYIEDFVASDTLDIEDPSEAFSYVSSRIAADLPSLFTSVSPVPFPHVGPLAVQYNAGSCKDMCDFLIYVCRALGIPCALNHRVNDTHYWISTFGKNGEEYSVGYINFPISLNENDPLYPHIKTKVFRLSYAINQAEISRLRRNRSELPFFFRIPLYENVTELFTGHFIKRFVVPNKFYTAEVPYGSVVYLCSSVRDGWTVEDYARKGLGNVEFRDIQKGDVLCVAIEEGGVMRPVTVPFMADPYSDDIRTFVQNGVHDKVVLFSKFSLPRAEEDLRERMRKGIFEGSDDASFTNPDTLFIVQSKPEKLYTDAAVYRQHYDKEYKYLRYRGGYDSYSGVAEVAFYDNAGKKIEFTDILGTSNLEDPSHEYVNAYDGNPLTSFNYHLPDGGWTGIRLTEPSEVKKIVYTPQNRVNYIYEGDAYELFYFDKGWHSLGVKVADTDSLVFNDVPDGNLLYLRNHSGGVQEMVFTYEDGKQVFHGCGLNISYLKSPVDMLSSESWKCRYSYLTPGDDWTSVDYDDSLWETGFGPFGQAKGCATPWSSPDLFVRYSFEMIDPGNEIALEYLINDSAELWLNGVKVAQLRGEGFPKRIALPKDLLISGVNLLAINCKNTDIMSENVMLDFAITSIL